MPTLIEEASDPNTPAERLAQLAHEYPTLRAAIAGHPAAYDGLLDWLDQVGDEQTRAAVAQRRAVPAPAPAAVPVGRYTFFGSGIALIKRVLSGRSRIIALAVVAVLVIAQVVAGIVILAQQHPVAQSHGYSYGPNVGAVVVETAALGPIRSAVAGSDGLVFAITDSELIAIDSETLSRSAAIGIDADSDSIVGVAGARVLVAGSDSDDQSSWVQVFDYVDGAFTAGATLATTGYDLSAGSVSPDGGLLYLPEGQGGVVVAMETGAGRVVGRQDAGGTLIYSTHVAQATGMVFVLALRPDPEPATIVVFSPGLDAQASSAQLDASFVNISGVNPEGTRVCIDDGSVVNFDGAVFTEGARIGSCVGFTPDGGAALADRTYEVRIRDADTGKKIFAFPTNLSGTVPVILSDPKLGFIVIDDHYGSGPTDVYRFASDAPRILPWQVLAVGLGVTAGLLLLALVLAFLIPFLRHRRATAPARRAAANERIADLARQQQDAVQAVGQQRQAAAHAERVQRMAEWEAAYITLHPGEPVPPYPAALAAPVGYDLSNRTNTMAILSLIFGFGGGLLGIIFGHVAHSQIRRTGERGWGLATAGLFFGYLGLIAAIAFLIYYVVVINALLR